MCCCPAKFLWWPGGLDDSQDSADEGWYQEDPMEDVSSFTGSACASASASTAASASGTIPASAPASAAASDTSKAKDSLVDALVRDTIKWQGKQTKGPRKPTEGNKATHEEKALANRWRTIKAHIKNGLVSEGGQERLSSVPEVDLQSSTAQLAADVRAWQREASSKKLPKRDRSGDEALLAKRGAKVLKRYDANELPPADKKALEALEGWGAYLEERKHPQ